MASFVSESRVLYLEKAPEADLRPWVRLLWYCRAPHLEHRYERVLPNGCIQVVLNLAGDHLTDCGDTGETQLPAAIVVGARERFELIATKDLFELAGIVVEPGGFAGLFRERADLLFEKSASFDDLRKDFRIECISEASSPAAKLAELESWLRKTARKMEPRPCLVEGALRFLSGPKTTVRACAKAAGVSERWLSQIFREHVGLSPKAWCRIQRFQRALRLLQLGDEACWADLALCCGYYDQSHFINDFRAFSGINPTTYSRQRGPWQNHVRTDSLHSV